MTYTVDCAGVAGVEAAYASMYAVRQAGVVDGVPVPLGVFVLFGVYGAWAASPLPTTIDSPRWGVPA